MRGGQTHELSAPPPCSRHSMRRRRRRSSRRSITWCVLIRRSHGDIHLNRSIVATALVAAAALTACSSEIPTTPSAQRSLTTLPSAAASVNEGSLTNEHVFVMSAAIPSDFNDAVAQAGGSVVYSIG